MVNTITKEELKKAFEDSSFDIVDRLTHNAKNLINQNNAISQETKYEIIKMHIKSALVKTIDELDRRLQGSSRKIERGKSIFVYTHNNKEFTFSVNEHYFFKILDNSILKDGVLKEHVNMWSLKLIPIEPKHNI